MRVKREAVSGGKHGEPPCGRNRAGTAFMFQAVCVFVCIQVVCVCMCVGKLHITKATTAEGKKYN